MPAEDIYKKAWEIYQSRIAGMGELRWKVLMIAITGATGLSSYAYIHEERDLYLIAVGLALACMYTESLYMRLQSSFVRKSLDVEHALRDIVHEKPDPYIPRNVVDTDPHFDSMPKFFDLFRPKRLRFWMPYVIIIVLLLGAYLSHFQASHNPELSPKHDCRCCNQ
jgi:hypothetical protein